MPYYDREAPESLYGAALDAYLSKGWYRSRQQVFTTDELWNDDLTVYYPVWWLRFPIREIKPHRSHDRIRKKNARFRVEFSASFEERLEDSLTYLGYCLQTSFPIPFTLTDALYEPTRTNVYDTKAIRVYDGKKLISVAVFDIGAEAVASILHFYDPKYARFSPGKYLILLTLDYMKANGYTLYYPGYVVSRRPEFDYKLFLGKESAYYYNRPLDAWLPFKDELLHREAIVPVNE